MYTRVYGTTECMSEKKAKEGLCTFVIKFCICELKSACFMVDIFHAVRTRSVTAPQKRVLDDATRKRRHQRQLEALEKDNFHDDPHAIYAHLTSKTKLPTFADGSESMGVASFRTYVRTVHYIVFCPLEKKKKTRTNADHFKQVDMTYSEFISGYFQKGLILDPTF